MFEICKMSSDKLGIGRCGSDNLSTLSNGYLLSDGIRVRLGINVVHVIENDVCTTVPLRRVSCNKTDRSRLVGDRTIHMLVYMFHNEIVFSFLIRNILYIWNKFMAYRSIWSQYKLLIKLLIFIEKWFCQSS